MRHKALLKMKHSQLSFVQTGSQCFSGSNYIGAPSNCLLKSELIHKNYNIFVFSRYFVGFAWVWNNKIPDFVFYMALINETRDGDGENVYKCCGRGQQAGTRNFEEALEWEKTQSKEAKMKWGHPVRGRKGVHLLPPKVMSTEYVCHTEVTSRF